MESTLKVDFDSSIGKPVIKIIIPKELNEDSDVRDKLLVEFLHTPSVVDRTSLFSISSFFDLKSDYRLTTIEPFNYFQILDRIKLEVLFRVMNAKDVSECNEYYDNNKNSEPNENTKSPAKYYDYLKIIDFFNWIGEQPYIEK